MKAFAFIPAKMKSSTLFLIILLTAAKCGAQISDTKAVFVKLPTYTKRLAYYKENNSNEKWLQLQEDVDSITRYIITDFTDNFAFAPVYYFYDTTLYLVKEGQPGKALFKANFAAITTQELEAIGNKYLVIEYGLSEYDATKGMYRLKTYYPNMELVNIPLIVKGRFDNSNTYYSPKFKIGYRGEARILSKKLERHTDGW